MTLARGIIATKETVKDPDIGICFMYIKMTEDEHVQTKTITSFSLERKDKVHFVAAISERQEEPKKY